MDASFHIRPFAFDRIFAPTTAPAAATGPDELRLQVAALEAELAQARHDAGEQAAAARAAGFDAGLAEARAERDAGLLAATDALHAAIENVDDRLDRIADEAARHACDVAHTAAGILAGRALLDHSAAATDEAIGRALRQVCRGQEIAISVAPDLVDEVEGLIAVRQAGDRRQLSLTVIADATLSIGDAHLAWDRGGIVLDAAARAEAVRAALEPVFVSGD